MTSPEKPRSSLDETPASEKSPATREPSQTPEDPEVTVPTPKSDNNPAPEQRATQKDNAVRGDDHQQSQEDILEQENHENLDPRLMDLIARATADIDQERNLVWDITYDLKLAYQSGQNGNRTLLLIMIAPRFTDIPNSWNAEIRDIIEAYNLGAEATGHPPFVPDAAQESPAQHVPNLSEEAPPDTQTTEDPTLAPSHETIASSEDRESVLISLDSIKDILIEQLGNKARVMNLDFTEVPAGIRLQANLDAGMLGGRISLQGTIVNEGADRIDIWDLDVSARGYVQSAIKAKLHDFFPTVKTFLERRYGRQIGEIHIAPSGLEVIFAASHTPEPAAESVLPRMEDTPQTDTESEAPEDADGSKSREAELATTEERLARLKAENLVHQHILDRLFGLGESGNPVEARHLMELTAEFGNYPDEPLFSPEERTVLIAAYNLGAKAVGHPLYAPPAADEAVETPTLIVKPQAEALDQESMALQEARQRLDTARAEYARLAVAAEKQAKNRLRERSDPNEGKPRMRINLLREDLTPIEGLVEAEIKYLDAVDEIRKLRGEQMRTDIEQEGLLLNKKEIKKQVDALIEETVIREGIALYDEKTRLRLTSESGSYPDRAWKGIQKCVEWYNNLDAYHRVVLNPNLPWYSKENLKARGHNIPRNKMIISAALFGASLGAGFAGLTAAGAIVGFGKLAQRTLGGMAVGVAADAGISKLFASLEKRRILHELKESRVNLAYLAEDIDAALNRTNDALDQKLLGIDAYKKSLLGKSTRTVSRVGGITVGALVGTGTAAHIAREGFTQFSELTGITPASVAQKLGASKDMIAKLIPRRGIAEALSTQQAGATDVPPAGGAAPKEPGFFEKMMSRENWKKVLRGSLGDDVSEPQKPTPAGTPAGQTTNAGENMPAPPVEAPPPRATPTALETPEDIRKQIRDLEEYHNKNYDMSTKISDPIEKSILAGDRVKLREQIRALQEKLESTKPMNEPSAPAPTQMPSASTTAEPGAKSGESSIPPPPEKSSPTPRTESAPDAAASIQKPSAVTDAPKTAPEVAARARILELATVRKGEGAWQAVRRQFYERIKAEPTQYGITAEDAQKLPELDKLGKGTRVAKILNRETLATLKNAGYINEDGTTRLGMRSDARVILSPDNKISLEYEGRGKPTYPFHEQKSDGVQTTDKAQGGRSMTSRSHPDYIAPRGTPELIAADDAPNIVSHEDHRTGPAGQAAEEAIAAKTESANLRAAHLTPTQYRPIARMKGEIFIKELDRHATEINEYRTHGGRKPYIFINRGALTTRGFRVELPQAEKYLDLSERLKKHLETLRFSERSRLLKQPVGELMRSLPLTKNK